MNATRKVKLKDITANLTCKLCYGYLMDATTVIECLHSFCKSCILKYLDKSSDQEEKYCPVCGVQLHSTKPLTSIRSDLMLQEIVFKLVPGLFKDEMSRRRKFYQESASSTPTTRLDAGDVFDAPYITSDDIIHLSLEYVTDDVKLKENTRRYLKCPAAVSVFILKKLLQGKYDLDAEASIDVMFGDRILPDDFLLMDVAYKYSWTMNGSKPLMLGYRIKGLAKPVIKFERTINDKLPAVQEPVYKPEEGQTPNRKVCNENGSNIMPAQDIKIKIPGNGFVNGEVTITPAKTPVNGKIKGRKRKHIRYSDIVIESTTGIKNLTKRLKIQTQDGMAQSDPHIDVISCSETGKIGCKEAKEVQLHISENGVMSARSVSSGEEKVIMNMAVPAASIPSPKSSQTINLPEKLRLSANCHSKTGPSGVTEIICDTPDPASSQMKSSTTKPGYVTLNIPNPNNPILAKKASVNKTMLNGRGNHKPYKQELSKQQKNFESGTSAVSKVTLTNGKSSPKKKGEKLGKSSLLQKLKSRLLSKSTDGENVIKAISDLGKLCNTSSSEQGIQHEEAFRPVGIHALPIMASLANPYQQQYAQRTKSSNGIIPATSTNNINPAFALPLALNFSPSSGMSVSMIPCTSTPTLVNGNLSLTTVTTNCMPQQVTPPKRVSHQTHVVNGDLKFTTSPKPILPKVVVASQDVSPKKPPKFFKSRQQSASPVSSPASITKLGGNLLSPQHRMEANGQKRKTPPTKLEKAGYPFDPHLKKRDRKGSPKQKVVKSFSTSSGFQTSTSGQQCSPTSTTTATSSHNTATNGTLMSRSFSSSPTDKLSQHLTALNNMSDPLSSSFGVVAAAAAAAALESNGSSLAISPFFTDNYCSLPFLNQRHPMPQLPYPFNYPTIGFPNLRPASSLASPQLSTVVTSSVPKLSHASPSSSNSDSRSRDDFSSTLDLTIGRSINSKDANDVKQQVEASAKSPLLIRLLNSEERAPPQEKLTSNESSPRKQITKSGELQTPKSDSGKIEELVSKKHSPKVNAREKGDNKDLDKEAAFSTKTNVPNGEQHLKSGGETTVKKFSNQSPAKTEDSCTLKNKTDPSKMSKCPGNNKTENSDLEKSKLLLCLSAQNNNDHTISNNHDKASEDSSCSATLLKSLDCANIPSSQSSTPIVAELSSKHENA